MKKPLPIAKMRLMAIDRHPMTVMKPKCRKERYRRYHPGH
jgi:hypothetical protein